MTQHSWSTEDGWEVLTGWDRPLQHFFFQISRPCPTCSTLEEGVECPACKDRGEEFLFDNLADKNGFTSPMGGMTLEQVNQVINKFLTDKPKGILRNLLEDRRLNKGNEITVHETVGKVRSQP